MARYITIEIREADTREGCNSYCDFEDMAFSDADEILTEAGKHWEQIFHQDPKRGPVWELWVHFVGSTIASVGLEGAGLSTHELEAIYFVMNDNQLGKVAWLTTEAQ
jgi:hypothetical protein